MLARPRQSRRCKGVSSRFVANRERDQGDVFCGVAKAGGDEQRVCGEEGDDAIHEGDRGQKEEFGMVELRAAPFPDQPSDSDEDGRGVDRMRRHVGKRRAHERVQVVHDPAFDIGLKRKHIPKAGHAPQVGRPRVEAFVAPLPLAGINPQNAVLLTHEVEIIKQVPKGEHFGFVNPKIITQADEPQAQHRGNDVGQATPCKFDAVEIDQGEGEIPVGHKGRHRNEAEGFAVVGKQRRGREQRQPSDGDAGQIHGWGNDPMRFFHRTLRAGRAEGLENALGNFAHKRIGRVKHIAHVVFHGFAEQHMHSALV